MPQVKKRQFARLGAIMVCRIAWMWFFGCEIGAFFVTLWAKT